MMETWLINQLWYTSILWWSSSLYTPTTPKIKCNQKHSELFSTSDLSKTGLMLKYTQIWSRKHIKNLKTSEINEFVESKSLTFSAVFFCFWNCACKISKQIFAITLQSCFLTSCALYFCAAVLCSKALNQEQKKVHSVHSYVHLNQFLRWFLCFI